MILVTPELGLTHYDICSWTLLLCWFGCSVEHRIVIRYESWYTWVFVIYIFRSSLASIIPHLKIRTCWLLDGNHVLGCGLTCIINRLLTRLGIIFVSTFILVFSIYVGKLLKMSVEFKQVSFMIVCIDGCSYSTLYFHCLY